jgi:hypothetical protein
MTCRAESERYLNVLRVVHGSGVANIRLADDIVGVTVSDNGVAIGMGELRRWRKERLAVFPVRDDHRGICSRRVINSGPIRRRETHTGP